MDAKVFMMLWLCTILHASSTRAYQCKIEQSSTEEKILPKLDDQFQTGVVATIVEKSYTFEVEEFYDSINNRAAAHVPPHSNNGVFMSQIYDFEYYQVFNILSNGSCISEDLHNNTKVLFAEINGHVLSPSQWMLFGSQSNVTYMGNTSVIRGIPVDHWSSCNTWDASSHLLNFKTDYYFSQSDYFNTTRPVRVEINGIQTSSYTKKSTPLHHIYDYVFYRPGTVQHTSVFEIPHGYLCIRNHTKELPKIPDLLTLNMERIIPWTKQVTYMKMVYDYPGKMTKLDIVPSPPSHYNKQFGARLLSVIHDYNSGVEYVIDNKRRNCTVQNIPLQDLYDGTIGENQTLVTMKHVAELMYSENTEWYYQGERMVNDIPCDVWASYFNASKYHINAKWVMELFFAKSDWKFGSESKPTNNHPVGTWVSMVKNDMIHTVWRTFELSSNYISDISEFDDVQFCYPMEAQRKHYVFKIEGNYDAVVSNNELLLQHAVRNMLASGAVVEPIRIIDIFFATTSKTTVDVWFTILDKPKVQGDAVDQIQQTTLDDAFNNINNKMKNGMSFVVQYDNDKKTVNVVKSSLKTDKDALDPRRPVPKKSGYGAGAMAGLGICMLIIGCIIGLVVAYFWIKRNSTAIPYERNQIS